MGGRVTVFPDKFLPGWQGETEDGKASRDGELLTAYSSPDILKALETSYPTDAHFVPYYLEGCEGSPRLNKGTHVDETTGKAPALGTRVLFDTLVLDVDGPGHKATQAWVHAQTSILDATPWGDTVGWYMTRGGYRLLWHLPEPLPPEEYIRILLRLSSLLSAYGIEADRLKDWTRVYRLPFVVRDGQSQRFPFDISWMEDGPIDLSTLGAPAKGSEGSTEGTSVFAGIKEARSGPLTLKKDVIPQNSRNQTLARLAGQWRRTGLEEDEILGMLRTINESRCDPPLPDQELCTIARSISRYEPEKKIAKEGDEDKGETSPGGVDALDPGGWRFLLGSEVEVAQHTCADLEGDGEKLVHDRSILWRYSAGRGIWDEIAPDKVHRVVSGYDGEFIKGKLDKNTGEPKLTPLKVGGNMIRNAYFIATSLRNRQKWLDYQADGICFRDCFVRVDAAGVHQEPFSPEHRQTDSLPFSYLPGSRPEQFIQLLRDVWEGMPDIDGRIQLLREFVGAALTNRAPSYQKGLLLIGNGANGKSTIQSIVKALFPPKTVTAVNPQDMDNEYRRAMLARSRLNVVSELPEADIMSSEAFKAMIDGSLIVGRKIRQEPFEFQPRAAHIFSANNLPGVRDMSRGFWRRWIVLEFKREFTEAEQDRAITGRIISTELAELACWALDGAATLAGTGHYTVPTSVDAAVNRWRSEADAVALFTEQKLHTKDTDGTDLPEDAWTPSTDLYNLYVQWLTTAGHKQMSQVRFVKRLKLLGIKSRHHHSKGTIYAVRVAPPRLVSEKDSGGSGGGSGDGNKSKGAMDV